MGTQFLKMHGIGNDFVVFDRRFRPGPPALSDPAQVRAIADRRFGIGCDQLILLDEPRAGGDVRVTFLNADGSESGACGNGTRCAALLAGARPGAPAVRLETGGGLLTAWGEADGTIAVDMGPPGLGWREVPLAHEADTLALPLARPGLGNPVGVSMGNPHAVFFVEDLAATDVAGLGPTLERDPLFPARANIGFAQVAGPGALRLRVWERGAGLTTACGTGACAAAVAAIRRGLTARDVAVRVDGGALRIRWQEQDGHVIMTGPATLVYRGEVDLPLAPRPEPVA